jgi:hypothetical protein
VNIIGIYIETFTFDLCVFQNVSQHPYHRPETDLTTNSSRRTAQPVLQILPPTIAVRMLTIPLKLFPSTMFREGENGERRREERGEKRRGRGKRWKRH